MHPSLSLTVRTSIIIFSILSVVTSAQEHFEFPGPVKEHAWLKKFTGTWTTTSKMSMGPDQPPIETTGTITSHMMGGFWAMNEMKTVFQGVPVRGLQTIGYDPAKKKYVGTWIDSMMNHLWLYEGTVDESGKKLTLDAEGPDMMTEGKLAKYRDTYEFVSADHIILTSLMLGEDGKWTAFVTGEAKRSKPAPAESKASSQR